MNPQSTSETPLGQDQEPKRYYLRVFTHPEFKHATDKPYKYSGLYVRLHGNGTSSVMLTPSSPIYLRGHFEPTGNTGQPDAPEVKAVVEAVVGKQVFTSPAERHAGRSWGLVLTTDPRDTKAVSGWQRAEIHESPQTEAAGWRFEDVELKTSGNEIIEGNEDTETVRYEQLVWKGDKIRVSAESADEEVYEWKGWMARKDSYGHPQLFWVTDKLEEEGLPEDCERIVVVKEYIQ